MDELRRRVMDEIEAAVAFWCSADDVPPITRAHVAEDAAEKVIALVMREAQEIYRAGDSCGPR